MIFRFPKVLIIVFIFIYTSAFSQEITLSSFLIPKELRENANAVVRYQLTEITVDAVDKMTVKKKKIVTILNKLGREEEGTYTRYDDNTKITKISAIIYDAFGAKIKKYTKSKFIDVSAVDGGTLYSDSRVKYLKYTPTSYPYTVVFESEYKTSSTGFVPNWFPTNGFLVSVEKSEYKLSNPKQFEFRTKEKEFGEYPIKNLSAGNNLHYVLTNQPAIKNETSSVSYLKTLPQLLVALNNFRTDGVNGFYRNWNEFGKWMNNTLLEGRGIVDGATKMEIEDLVEGVDDDMEKAKIVYQFMQNKTRYISVQVGIGGIQPIAANEVDKMGYGDCKGLTNYTKALLDIVGVESYYTHVEAGEGSPVSFERDFASLEQGNHVILNIPNKGNDIWLECTNQTLPFGFLGSFTDDRDVLVMTPKGGVIKHTTSYKNEQNLQETKGTIRLDLLGNVKADFYRKSYGIQYDDKYSYETMSQKELIAYYKSKVWASNNNLSIDRITLVNDKDSITFKESFNTKILDYASISESNYLFKINVFNRNNYIPKRYRKRKLPLKISRGYLDIDEFMIQLPKGFTALVVPSVKVLETKYGRYEVRIEKINTATLKYYRSILIKDGEYPKEDYKMYRSFRRKIAKYDNLRIALTKL